MIKTKRELEFYLKADMMMNRGVFEKDLKSKMKEIIAPDYIMEYLRCLRRVEYYENCRGGY